MPTLSEGARQLPLRHISIRVPWHDRAWDGAVCDEPEANTSCLILPRIAEEKDDGAEQRVAAKFWRELPESEWPACAVERGALMSNGPFTRTVSHPYAKSSKAHRHFAPTPFEHVGFSANCIPFKWMLSKDAADRVEALKLTYDQEAEAAVHEEMGFPTNWIQVKRNQLVMLDTFFSAIQPEESLCFFYAKDTPLANDPRRVIVGVGRVRQVMPWVEYRYSSPGTHQAVLWDRIVRHSLEPTFKDGFLLPYQEIHKRAQADPSIDPASMVAFAPEECWAEFSFGTEHVSHDSAVAALLSCADALRRIGDVVPGDWSRHIAWIDAELNRIWRLRGPFPGLGSVLKALGIEGGNLIAYDLALSQRQGDAEWHEDAWQLVEQAIQDPSLLSEGVRNMLGKTERDLYKSLAPGRKRLLRLLSRFDISEDQATRFYQQTEREKAGILISDEEILENPYLLYETDRFQPDPIPLGVVDRGMFPDPIVGAKHPMLEATAADGPLDVRRARALLVRELEQASTSGHTLQPRKTLIQAVRDLELRPPCEIGLDAAVMFEKTFAPEIDIAEMADGSVAYQLTRLRQIGRIIRDDVQKRVNGKRHQGNLDWRVLVDAAFEDPVKSPEEELARQEKAAALQELYCSRLSVLVGPAGTGKTTLLKVLCEQPEVKKGGILLLAPTGKARVRMETQIGISGAQTIAQFLVKRKRYDPHTGRYHTAQAEKSDVGQTIIIDEASMLTEEQLGALLDALKAPTRLVLVGDPNQLPPIGSGRPFVDIVRRVAPKNAETAFPIVAPGYAELTIRMRHLGVDRADLNLAEWFSSRHPGPDDDAIWSQLANGKASEHLKLVRWDNDEELDALLVAELQAELKLKNAEDEETFEERLGGQPFGSAVYFNFKRDPKESIAASAEAWQVLSPVRGGLSGVERLNRSIQERFRKRARSWAEPEKLWDRKTTRPFGRHGILYGDKVINVRNGPRDDMWPKDAGQNYVANGEIGIVVGQYKGKSWTFKGLPWKLEVEFSSQKGAKYGYHAGEFGEEDDQPLELAYALTVHKCQGSEFETVILVVPNPCRLLSPELLYTALTRQKQRIVVLHQGPLIALKNYSQGQNSETARRLTNLFEAPSPVEVKSRFLEDRLIHRTRRGEVVRSKSEVIVADMLYSLSIDYEYEKELVASDGTSRLPDFTIDDPASGLKVFWEHLGMLSVRDYKAKWEQKLKWYANHKIIPYEQQRNHAGQVEGILVTSEDLPGGAIDSRELERKARLVLGLGV